ncbi:chemotaxis protein CheW [Oceanobacillus sp. CAU 1775]
MIKKYITFKLNDQFFGIKINFIRSIERLRTITPLPKTHNYIKGIINQRDQLTPIIDLKKRLNMAESEASEHNRFLIVQNEDIQVGLLVDAATEVIDISASVIQAAPEIISNDSESYIYGIAKLEDYLLTLIDIEQLLDFKKIFEVKKEFVG